MKKSRLLAWVVVLLYMVSTLGMAAWAEDDGGEYWDDTPTVDGAPSEGSENQDPPADPGSSNSGGESSDAGEGLSDPGTDPDDPGPADPAGESFDFSDYFQDGDSEFDDEDGEELPAVYQVWFITPSGHILLNYEAAAGTPVNEPGFAPNSRKGNVFAFWYEVGGDVTPFEFDTPLEGDLVLAAYFKAVVVEEEPEEEEEEEELPPLQASITSDAGEVVYDGDVITLTAHVSEWTEAYDCASLWRYNDGSGWVVAATDTRTHSFAVNEASFYWRWEFVFTVRIDAALNEA